MRLPGQADLARRPQVDVSGDPRDRRGGFKRRVAAAEHRHALPAKSARVGGKLVVADDEGGSKGGSKGAAVIARVYTGVMMMMMMMFTSVAGDGARIRQT